MAYFAEVQDGIVQRVIAISNSDAPDPATQHSEPLGQAFIRDVLGLAGDWVQTSYNDSFRAHYAGIGYVWDAVNNVFYAPQPYPSWVLNTDHVECGMRRCRTRTTATITTWDEDAQEWVLVTDE
jgi:hypothetical protein